jgi:ABC-type transporter Mla subunit MlaD
MTGESRNNPDKLDQILDRLNGLVVQVNDLSETQSQFNERLNRLTRDLAELRQENAKEFERLSNTMMGLYASQDKKAEEERQKNEKFREQMLTMMDVVRKEYDMFKVEKTAIAAGQDRLQKDVDGLNVSDAEQNQAIAELD